jgi:hypothetical protein
MPAELAKIPGVGGSRRRVWSSRRRDPLGLPRRATPRFGLAGSRPIAWGSVAVWVGCAGVAAYVAHAGWSASRVHVSPAGLARDTTITSKALADRTVRFTVDPSDRIARARVLLDGKPLPDKAVQVEGPTLTWHPGWLDEGVHHVTVTVPRMAMPQSTTSWRFVVDDTAPRIDVPVLVPATALCTPVTIQGRVEKGAVLTLDGKPLLHKGSFTLRYPQPPTAPIHLGATDRAGNHTDVEVVVPVRYPGGQGVHVSAAAWGYEPLRNGILALIDAHLVSVVELDLKDEDGIVGYDSTVPLAQRIGAVDPEYKLKEAVADLTRRGVRVVGRIVAFKDPQLAEWAWDNGHRDWVVQDDKGGMLSGGFTSHSSADVQHYNLDIALEASAAGVDDILWDYVRRPEGDPDTMRIPGLKPGATSADAVVDFLTMTRAALAAHCTFQGASVFGIAADRPDTVGQDVPRIARHVDYIAPMVYPSHWVDGEYQVDHPNEQPFDIVKASLAAFQADVAGTGTPLVPWLQDFSLGYTYGPKEVRAQIDAAAQLGISDWLLWNPGVRYTTGALSPSLVRVRP